MAKPGIGCEDVLAIYEEGREAVIIFAQAVHHFYTSLAIYKAFVISTQLVCSFAYEAYSSLFLHTECASEHA
ncbi:MAG: hypothetical protein EF812_05500 [Methanosarcinales archaeon]|nr:MAG: hypothetical protein EF812_05500 [Methanosarcinales archaeon]